MSLGLSFESFLSLAVITPSAYDDPVDIAQNSCIIKENHAPNNV